MITLTQWWHLPGKIYTLFPWPGVKTCPSLSFTGSNGLPLANKHFPVEKWNNLNFVTLCRLENWGEWKTKLNSSRPTYYLQKAQFTLEHNPFIKILVGMSLFYAQHTFK